MRNRLLTFFIAIIFFTYVATFAISETGATEIASTAGYTAEDVTRLHIVGADNSEVNQRIKYVVRDSLSEYVAGWCAECGTKARFDEYCAANVHNIEDIVNEVLAGYDVDYTAHVNVGRAYFPMRMYGDVILPAGEYDAVNVVLGEGEGNNWWCILFPRMCYGETSSENVEYRSRTGDWLKNLFKKKKK